MFLKLNLQFYEFQPLLFKKVVVSHKIGPAESEGKLGFSCRFSKALTLFAVMSGILNIP